MRNAAIYRKTWLSDGKMRCSAKVLCRIYHFAVTQLGFPWYIVLLKYFYKLPLFYSTGELCTKQNMVERRTKPRF